MNETVCPICYESIGLDNCSTTPCNHRFHCNCLIEHVYSHANDIIQCPVCRQEGLRINNTITGASGPIPAQNETYYSGTTGAYYSDASGTYYGPSGTYYGPSGTYYRPSGTYYGSPVNRYVASPIISSISNLIQSYTTLDQNSTELVNIRVVVEPSGNTTANITRLRKSGDYGVTVMAEAFNRASHTEN